MRTSTIVTGTLVAIGLTGAASVAHAAIQDYHVVSPATVTLKAQQARTSEPAEDDPAFNCKRHGDQSCGVAFDATPNNSNHTVQRYVIQFDSKGRPVSVRPYGR